LIYYQDGEDGHLKKLLRVGRESEPEQIESPSDTKYNSSEPRMNQNQKAEVLRTELKASIGSNKNLENKSDAEGISRQNLSAKNIEPTMKHLKLMLKVDLDKLKLIN
jgi:hypothetical protein